MAQATEFKGQNVIFAKDQPQYNPLPAFRDSNGLVITCHKFSPEEIEEINKTGCCYLSMLTFNQPLQPVRIEAKLEDLIELIPD